MYRDINLKLLLLEDLDININHHDIKIITGLKIQNQKTGDISFRVSSELPVDNLTHMDYLEKVYPHGHTPVEFTYDANERIETQTNTSPQKDFMNNLYNDNKEELRASANEIVKKGALALTNSVCKLLIKACV
jgi:hypothetical protein